MRNEVSKVLGNRGSMSGLRGKCVKVGGACIEVCSILVLAGIPSGGR